MTQDILESIDVVNAGGTCGLYNFADTTLSLVNCVQDLNDVATVCVGKFSNNVII